MWFWWFLGFGFPFEKGRGYSTMRSTLKNRDGFRTVGVFPRGLIDYAVNYTRECAFVDTLRLLSKVPVGALLSIITSLLIFIITGRE